MSWRDFRDRRDQPTEPEWRRQGWIPAGPRRCRCPVCGLEVSTSANARAAHQVLCAEPKLFG